jgi:hypothetical protein
VQLTTGSIAFSQQACFTKNHLELDTFSTPAPNLIQLILVLTWLPNTNANADCHSFPELLDWRKSMVIETQSDFPNAFRRKATRSSSVSALWNHCVKLHILGLSTSVFPRRKSRAEYSQGRRTCNQTDEERFTRSTDQPLLLTARTRKGNDFNDGECRLRAKSAAQPDSAQHRRHDNQDATQAQQPLYRSMAMVRRAKRNWLRPIQ